MPIKRSLTERERQLVANALRENLDVANEVHGKAMARTSSFYIRYGKRALDIVISSVALFVTAPINAVLAVGTLIDVGRPIFFRQTRVGKGGRLFTIAKFRNMTNEVDERGELLPPEKRVTKWGRFVRSTSLDELLNFWCVLKGDMSIIGPRPLLVEYTNRYCEYHRSRLAVKPGLECPPDPRLIDADGWEMHFQNDVWYAENVSLVTDIKKLVRLAEMAFNRSSSHVRGGAGRSFFMGYDANGYAISLRDLDSAIIEKALMEDSLD